MAKRHGAVRSLRARNVGTIKAKPFTALCGIGVKVAWWSLYPQHPTPTRCSPSASPITHLPPAPLGALTMPSLAPSHPTPAAHVPKRQVGPNATPAVNRSPLRPHTRPPRPRRVPYLADAIPYRFSSAKHDLTRARPLRAPDPPFRPRCQKWQFHARRLDRALHFKQFTVSPGRP